MGTKYTKKAMHRIRGVKKNMSRKQILIQKHGEAQRKASGMAKRERLKKSKEASSTALTKTKAKFAARRVSIQQKASHATQFKRTVQRTIDKTKKLKGAKNRIFDHEMLKTVHDGLVETIEQCGEKPTPTGTFALALTTLQNNPRSSHVPYLLTILAACVQKVSAGVIISRFSVLMEIVSGTLKEHATSVESSQLHVGAAMKVIKAMCFSLDPSLPLLSQGLMTLEPARNHSFLMPQYLTLIRKWLQAAKDKNYLEFFMANLPKWVTFMCSLLTETRSAVASAAQMQLTQLLEATVTKSTIVTSYFSQWNDIIASLCEVFKSHSQSGWTLVLPIVTSLFTKLRFLKAELVQNPDVYLKSAMPKVSLLLCVLDKVRLLDQEHLNHPVENAMSAIGNCMTMQEFMEIIPFNPHEQQTSLPQGPEQVQLPEEEEELNSSDSDIEEGGTKSRSKKGRGKKSVAQDPWKRSYLMLVYRRIASHDSLPFLVEAILPRISDCMNKMKMCENDKTREIEYRQWEALQHQYWRVLVNFCVYPNILTNESFRALAKALIATVNNQPGFTTLVCSAFHVLCSGYHKLAEMEETDEALYDSEDDEEEDNGDDEEGIRHCDLQQDASFNPHQYHNISQQQAKEGCVIFSKYSVNIMPKLCNTFEVNQSTAVLNAISSFSKVCSPSVMETILTGVMDLCGNMTASEEEEQSSELLQKISAKRRVVLDVAVAMVGHLTPEHLERVFDGILEPVLSSENSGSSGKEIVHRILQKKAYKLLLAMLEYRMMDLHVFLPRIATLLAKAQAHVTVSGMKMRLKCLSWMLDGFKMFYVNLLPSLVEHAVGEVVLCTKQHSHVTRELAIDIIEKMHRYLRAANQPAKKLLHLVLAGFAGKTPMMLSASIVALAKLMWVAHAEYSEHDIQEVVQMCTTLMQHALSEIRSAAATFCRMMLKLMTHYPRLKKAMDMVLPKILETIALVTKVADVSSYNKKHARQLLERILKVYGFEKIEAIFPKTSMKYLLYVGRMQRRSDRLKEREENHASLEGEEGKEDFRHYFMPQPAGGRGDSEDDEEDDEGIFGSGGLKQLGGGDRSVKYELVKGLKDEEESDDEYVLKMDGAKLRIVPRADHLKEENLRKRKELAAHLLARGGAGGGPSITATTINDLEGGGTSRKRKRVEVTDFENEELIAKFGTAEDKKSLLRNVSSGGEMSGGRGAQPSGITRAQRENAAALREKKKEKLEEGVKTGEEFGSERALGDRKRGGVDPFAYVPLDRKYLNKRNALAGQQRLKIVAHKGMKGAKAVRVLQQKAKEGQHSTALARKRAKKKGKK